MTDKSGMMNSLAERIAGKSGRGEAWLKPSPAQLNSAHLRVDEQAAAGNALNDALNDALPGEWREAGIMDLPRRKEPVNIRLDADVLAWFRQSGKGYQTRMNNVLRAFVESRGGV